MTLSIEISGKYRITSDAMQIVIQRKKLVDPTKSPAFKTGMSAEPYEKWTDWKFCGKVSQALDIMLAQQIFESDAQDLRTLRNEISSFRREISAQLDD